MTTRHIVVVAAIVLGLASAARADYHQRFASWQASADNTWETKSLAGSPFNVPANAVVEIALVNYRDDKHVAGVREYGSSLNNRKWELDKPKDGGNDVMTMHVQTDASSRIECLADKYLELDFVLMGYWDRGVYVEKDDGTEFQSDEDALWDSESLDSEGVPPGAVVEVLIWNQNGNIREAGLRSYGSSLNRRLVIDHKEKNTNMLTMWVQADDTSSARIEVYAEKKGDVKFAVLGYWSEPPGRYTEKWVDLGVPASNSTWRNLDLSAHVSGQCTAEILFGSKETASGSWDVGVREYGISVERRFGLHLTDDSTALDGLHAHATTNGASFIQWYAEQANTTDSAFYLAGYWTPGRDVLMTVVNPASLTTQETLHRDKLEDLGHIVELIDESAIQTSYDTAVARNDLAYVPEEISSSQVASKLTDAPIGVLVEEIQLYDELLMADAGLGVTDSTLDITDGTHFITSSLGAGVHTIMTAGADVTRINTGLASHVDVLAEWNAGQETLGVLEPGGFTTNGTRAAGRRGILPWGHDSFDLALMNANGDDLFERSILWASNQVGHWRFDETSGTTAYDTTLDNDGTVTAGTWELARVDNGLRLNGTTSKVTVSSDPRLDFRGDFSITGWFKLDSDFDSSTTTSQILVAKYLDNDHNLVITLVGTDYGSTNPDDGSLAVKVENGAGGEDYRYSWTNRTSWKACEWYHFAVVGSSANGANNTIYIRTTDDTDGSGAGGTGLAAQDLYFAADLTIGGGTADSGQLATARYFEGEIDDVRIYRQALTQPEIDAIHRLGQLYLLGWEEAAQ